MVTPPVGCSATTSEQRDRIQLSVSALARDTTGSPMQECDIVMRGGVTSGVVYPLAIAELSEKYRFRNIGGTSVGAIGAAAAAAAEYRRRHSSNAGFEELQRLPEVLKQSGFLLDLFRPLPATRPLFNALMQLTGSTTHMGSLLRLITQLLLGVSTPGCAWRTGPAAPFLYLPGNWAGRHSGLRSGSDRHGCSVRQ